MQTVTSPVVRAFRHEPSGTFSYVVREPSGPAAAVIDPVADFEYRAGRISHDSAGEIVAYCREHELRVVWILETHAHADHLSDAPWLREQFGGPPIAIGRGITRVQSEFKKIFNLPEQFPADGSQFDRLFDEGDIFRIGALEGRVIATPGHTSDSNSFLIGDAVFVGDSLFAPDFGTARCDFPGGDAGQLYDSIHKLYQLPEETRVFLCHDYPPAHRGPIFQTTIGEQKRTNRHVRADTGRDEFIRLRTERDATLAMPELLIPSVQVNINTGKPMPPDVNGTSYIKVPLNVFPGDPKRLRQQGFRP